IDYPILAGGLPVAAGGSAPPLSRSSAERGALGTPPRRDHRSCFARESCARPAASDARQAALGALITACSAVRASDALLLLFRRGAGGRRASALSSSAGVAWISQPSRKEACMCLEYERDYYQRRAEEARKALQRAEEERKQAKPETPAKPAESKPREKQPVPA